MIMRNIAEKDHLFSVLMNVIRMACAGLGAPERAAQAIGAQAQITLI